MSILQALQRDEVAKRFECLLLAPAVMGSTFSVRASEISGPGIDKAWRMACFVGGADNMFKFGLFCPPDETDWSIKPNLHTFSASSRF